MKGEFHGSSGAVLASLQGVRKSYGRIQALAGVDLTVHGGRMLALLGPNGAGKSTAIGLLLGQDTPDAGTATLLAASPHALAARRRIGVMLQDAGIPETLKVGELLALTRASEGMVVVPSFAIVERVGFAPRVDGQLRVDRESWNPFSLWHRASAARMHARRSSHPNSSPRGRGGQKSPAQAPA